MRSSTPKWISLALLLLAAVIFIWGLEIYLRYGCEQCGCYYNDYKFCEAYYLLLW